jgi:hypothetical protein
MEENLSDFHAYRREVMRLKGCLSMAKVSYFLEQDKQGDKYMQSAKRYFEATSEWSWVPRALGSSIPASRL